jgi:hypothetical protein
MKVSTQQGLYHHKTTKYSTGKYGGLTTMPRAEIEPVIRVRAAKVRVSFKRRPTPWCKANTQKKKKKKNTVVVNDGCDSDDVIVIRPKRVLSYGDNMHQTPNNTHL